MGNYPLLCAALYSDQPLIVLKYFVVPSNCVL